MKSILEEYRLLETYFSARFEGDRRVAFFSEIKLNQVIFALFFDKYWFCSKKSEHQLWKLIPLRKHGDQILLQFEPVFGKIDISDFENIIEMIFKKISKKNSLYIFKNNSKHTKKFIVNFQFQKKLKLKFIVNFSIHSELILVTIFSFISVHILLYFSKILD